MAPTLIFFAALAACAVLAGPMARMLARGMKAKNYRGQSIPTGMGVVLLLAVLTALETGVILGWLEQGQFALYAFWLTLVCLAGLVDDAAGNHENRGFRGHFSALLRGELTTGMAKVIIVTVGAAALAAVPLSGNALLKLGVLLLAVNLFNQLDLRPGRALKAFLLISGVFALAGSLPSAAGCGGALGLLAGDLKARHMLGDAGANLLGALVGLTIITGFSGTGLILLLILLALGNAAGEIMSFSRLIEGSRALNWLDKLGR